MNYSTLRYSTGSDRERAPRYFARSPTLKAVSGSLALCAVHFLSLPSDPAVTRNAIAIGMSSPWSGDACFFQQAGFARYAGQTKKASIAEAQ